MKNRIIFFGTPEFAAFQLRYLIKEGFNIVGVVTTPDRPKGRGRKLQACEVKETALAHNIPVLEPNNLKSEEFNEELIALKPDLQVVVAFRMLPEKVWKLPNMGTINLHASLLPNYRGAAPINHTIINGEEKSGVSTFLLKHEIDTGNILLQKEVDIDPNDNAGDLHDKLMQAGAPLLAETIRGLFSNEITPVDQQDLINKENISPKHAPKIFKDDCKLSLSQPVAALHNKIRGLSPYPGAFFDISYLDKPAVLKIYKSELLDEGPKLGSGKLEFWEKKLVLGLENGVIALEMVQISGKQRMSGREFANGFQLNKIIFSS
ncbi:methionyl-tRNA formyltransferase [Luteibaculum oceani]|uniref:Methionyl-tRNA formyltransferase n=1 Tax=Luteibaculum oceani TaxID=1294296 RepID=A0A5C6UZ27_9FLAO|nr:methionyl-tRNA formyltransferase [Luteibaculum oceani]TXC76238.1 methionyl-tRNA formyltransferase [Luteibaculum oceani]